MDALIHAPDFPAGFAWLNTRAPLTFSGNLKGQIVLLDFWTYSCINCLHVLEDLHYLQNRFRDDPFLIVGVHSAKHDNERDPSHIRAALFRHSIRHPVLIDQRHRVWSEYDVSAWPTLILIGPTGRIIGGVSGEGHRDLLEHSIRRALEEGRANNTLAPAPLDLQPEESPPSAALAFPAKVLADKPNDRLILLDSNHHRLLITTFPDAHGGARLRHIIGTGEPGAFDGPFHAAQFHRPQGGALAGNILYLADTGNHLIRRIDLAKQTVSTMLGTGRQVFDPEAGKTATDQPLNSPWDLAVGNNRLYISQAGQHQIFAMNLLTGMTEIVAGSGHENLRDGPALAANLAQPSGLALDPSAGLLYFADAEVSAIRGLDLQRAQVFTLVGHGLFEFGDADGNPDIARLQHPLGLALAPDRRSLLVADTFNHKIKEIDLQTRLTTTRAGDPAGLHALSLFEPAGIAIAGQEAFIADTNHHRIVRLNLATGAWHIITIENLPGTNAPDQTA